MSSKKSGSGGCALTIFYILFALIIITALLKYF